MRGIVKRMPSMLAVAVAALLASTGMSQQAQAHSQVFLGQSPIADDVLASMRGGFSMGNGINIRIGLEQLSFINGILATTTYLSLDDIKTSMQSTTTSTHTVTGTHDSQPQPQSDSSTGSMASVEHVPTIPTSGTHIRSMGDMGTIIQNSLDNQQIQHLNIFDIEVGGSQFTRHMNVNFALQSALSFLPRRY